MTGTTSGPPTTVRLGDLLPNPFRGDVALIEEKVRALEGSIRSTGFWNNVIARRAQDGKVELAFGHHRVEAAKRVYGPDYEIAVAVRDLDDEAMLRMLADENVAEWNATAGSLVDAVRAVVLAYAGGKIQLDAAPKKTPKNRIRHAPSFQLGDVGSGSSQHAYTADTVAQFFGEAWIDSDGRAKEKVKTALAALERIELGSLDEAELTSMSLQQMRSRVRKSSKRTDPDQQPEQVEVEVETEATIAAAKSNAPTTPVQEHATAIAEFGATDAGEHQDAEPGAVQGGRRDPPEDEDHPQVVPWLHLPSAVRWEIKAREVEALLPRIEKVFHVKKDTTSRLTEHLIRAAYDRDSIDERIRRKVHRRLQRVVDRATALAKAFEREGGGLTRDELVLLGVKMRDRGSEEADWPGDGGHRLRHPRCDPPCIRKPGKVGLG